MLSSQAGNATFVLSQSFPSWNCHIQSYYVGFFGGPTGEYWIEPNLQGEVVDGQHYSGDYFCDPDIRGEWTAFSLRGIWSSNQTFETITFRTWDNCAELVLMKAS